ncbi:MAG: glycosyltransferase family 4 protein [Thermoleophilia bacterium]|nr:glycosyltransferase family 4 protein [Thermoleophilia bacterium]
MAADRLRVFTWHVHGSYLQYLARAPHDFLLPVTPARTPPYHGRGRSDWPANLIEVPARGVDRLDIDCVLFQTEHNWTHDQWELLSDEQRAGPRVFLEHDPPREVPTDTRHHVDDPNVLLVHVTPFNELMWDNGGTPTRVIDHGVPVTDRALWTGELDRGLVVVNNLGARGRRLGLDVWESVRREVPLDLVGIGSEQLGGLGEVPHAELPAFAARYRFLFNPIRYTSLGLAVLEAMAVGLPVVALATTEYATAIENGVSGYVDTRVDTLVKRMHALLSDRDEARRLGEGARRRAEERFGIERFARDWDLALRDAVALAGTGGEVATTRST